MRWRKSIDTSGAHTNGLPIFQVNKDIPSGLLPSSSNKLLGSNTAGTPKASEAADFKKAFFNAHGKLYDTGSYMYKVKYIK